MGTREALAELLLNPKPMLISWHASDGVLRCRDHGVLADAEPALTHVKERL